MLKCYICKQYKDSVEFYKDRSRASGHCSSCKLCGDRKKNIRRLKSRGVKITESLYDSLQSQTCYICNSKDICIDHCHKTGDVRGVLCNNCNLGIGLFKDNVERLRKAIKYLGGGGG